MVLHRLRGLALAVPLALSTIACVDPFTGSHIEFTLGPGAHIPGDQMDGFGRPPSGTHYEMWVVRDNVAFYLKSYRVVPVIDRAEPCFIDDDEATFPGLHSTMIFEKTMERYPPVDGQPVTHLADAERREANQALIETRLKAIVSHDEGVLEAEKLALEAELAAAGIEVTDIDDASNAARAEICKRFFAAHPTYYVGNDRVFALPISGLFYGMVDGSDPRNSAFVGGAGFDVEPTFPEFDALWVTWQFDDPADPRIGVAAGQYQPSETGYHYMSGTPVERVRGVINVPLVNAYFGQINGEAAIYAGVDEDIVNF